MPPCVVTARYHADSHHITPTSFAQQRAMVLHIALSIARTHCVTGNTSIGCSSTSSHVCEQFDQGSPACRLALSRLATTSNRIPSTSIGPAFRSAADGGPSHRRSRRSQKAAPPVILLHEVESSHSRAVFADNTIRAVQHGVWCCHSLPQYLSYHTNEHRAGVSLDSGRWCFISL